MTDQPPQAPRERRSADTEAADSSWRTEEDRAERRNATQKRPGWLERLGRLIQLSPRGPHGT